MSKATKLTPEHYDSATDVWGISATTSPIKPIDGLDDHIGVDFEHFIISTHATEQDARSGIDRLREEFS